MAKLTIVFGILIELVGIAGHGTPGAVYTVFAGVGLLIFGLLAQQNASQRKLWMHIAVTIGLVELAIAVTFAVKALRNASSVTTPRIVLHDPIAAAILSLIFVAMCIWSFIAARRARNTQG